MNDAYKATTKTIALFLALGIASSLVGYEMNDTDQDQDKTPTEQAEPNSQDDGGEGGEGN